MKRASCHFLPSFCEFLPLLPSIGVNMAKSGLPTYETPLQKRLLERRVFADAFLPLFAEFLQPVAGFATRAEILNKVFPACAGVSH